MSNKNYFHAFFSDNLNNMKNTWNGINSLINNKRKKSKVVSWLKHLKDNSTTKDPLEISDIFNRYFTSIGHNLATQVPSSSQRSDSLNICHLITIFVFSTSIQSRQMISNVRFCLFLKTKLMLSILVRFVFYSVLSVLYLFLSQTYLICLCRMVGFHPN